MSVVVNIPVIIEYESLFVKPLYVYVNIGLFCPKYIDISFGFIFNVAFIIANFEFIDEYVIL